MVRGLGGLLGLLGLTKLRGKGITEVRKMRGEYNGDQVEGHKSQGAACSPKSNKQTPTTELKMNCVINSIQGGIDELSQCPDIKI